MVFPNLGISFADTITLGAILTAVLVLVVGGLPWKLIKNLREERDLWQGQTEACKKEIHDKDMELASLRARTDLEPVLQKIESVVVAVQESAERSASRHSDFATHLEANIKVTQGLVQQIHGAGQHLEQQTKILERMAQQLLAKEEGR